MNKDEFIREVAELVQGLQVPVSLRAPLGTAREPWEKLKDLGGFGWLSADDFERAFHKKVEWDAYQYDEGKPE